MTWDLELSHHGKTTWLTTRMYPELVVQEESLEDMPFEKLVITSNVAFVATSGEVLARVAARQVPVLEPV